MVTLPAPRPKEVISPGDGAHLWAVQWMRAAAALMVVIGHSQSAVARIAQDSGRPFLRSTLLPWGAGVDLFFVISGFIMVHSSRGLFARPGAARGFITRRLIRIVPLYWAATTLFLMVLAAASLKGGAPFPGRAAILASYLFVPWDATGNGQAFPVLDLGWTLNDEMFFYGLFTFVLWRAPRGAVALALGLLTMAVMAGLGAQPGMAAAYAWSRPILLDFALGLVIGLAVIEGIVLPMAPRLALVGGGIALLALDPLHVFTVVPGVTVANEWPRVTGAGLPATLILAGAVLGPARPVSGWLTWPTRLGDASYSLYLLHPFALMLMGKLTQKWPRACAWPGLLLVSATVLMAIAIAMLSHRHVERPLNRRLQRWAAGGPKPGHPSAPSSSVIEGATT